VPTITGMTEPAGTPESTTDVLRRVNAMGAGTLIERMGIVITEVAADRLVATMPVEGNTQPYGLLHGGASVVLAETMGSLGSVLHAGPDRAAVGLDINATHHRAVRSGTVTGTAQALHLGRTTASWQVEIVDDRGRAVCTSRISCLLRDVAPGA
jgi:1,4-dihydroxy-2-naphthoyl-CoA hydrolase